MVGFLFKFLCIFYVAVVVNTRTLNSNSEKNGNFGDIFSFLSRNDPAEQKYKDKREVKPTHNEMEKILASVTEKVNQLKETYGEDKYKTFIPKLDKIIYEYSTQKAKTKKTTFATTTMTEDVDFLGTEQIEKLLNDIKARAIQMVAEQNPSVTDIIANTVTEATFEADPILTHLEMSSPGYALTTFVCLNNIENMNIANKRTANDSNIILISNKDSKHNMSARSVKEDAYTLAQNMEDMLQKELKSIYKKVKNKVSKDFHKEVKQAKSTLKCESSKIIHKVTNKGKTLHSTTKYSSASRHNRGYKTTKAMEKFTNQHEVTTPTSTVDDFAMLTLYEQILTKTHEDNVMKMLMTNKKRKIDKTIRLSKRNPETLTDLTLKKDIKRINDDGETIPDTDYNNDIVISETPSDYSLDLDTDHSTAESFVSTHTTEAAPFEDTSFEGLTDKISYKDYVNGYKNYLNFQKDQANQNFSALVKYQAHRHHKVDDIGKFILSKIPQIPQRRKRHFFDDSDMDEQDVATKSDDSWFKKHFYMFIDNGPPKKYHTSETVEFKDVTESSRDGHLADNMQRPELKLISPGLESASDGNTEEMQTADINLDELSEVLEDSKIAATRVPELNKVNPEKVESVGFQVYAPNILTKFFEKVNRSPVKANQINNANTLKYDDDEDNSFLFNSDLDRFRRNAKKQIKATEKVVNKNLAQTTILDKQGSDKLDKTKTNEKVGCVSIVSQPTAIVNLHKTKVKGGKIKNLLSKLHFYKRNKNSKKEKRHCTRVQRFNPIKKLRNMFMPKQNSRVMASSNNEADDYNMLTSHIDTFKPVKYNQIPSVNELRNQIPNITGNIATNNALPEKYFAAQQDSELVKDDTTKTDKVLNDIGTSVEMRTFPVIMSNTSPILQTPKKQSKVKSYTQKVSVDPNMLKDSFAVTDGVMNVNVKTIPKLDDFYTPEPIENISTEIDKIQRKLFTEANWSDFSTSSKNTVKGKPIGKNDKGYNKDLSDDITVKAKLTRIIKYPLKSKLKYTDDFTEINSVGDNPKLYKFVDSKHHLNVHEESDPYLRTPFFEKQSTNATNDQNIAVSLKRQVDFTLNNLEDTGKIKGSHRSYKTYPDYFNDLVMWNSDILNYDKVSNPTWQDILKNIETEQEFTTPDLRQMQEELNKMKEHLTGIKQGHKDSEQIAKFTATTEITPSSLSSPRYVAKANKIKVEVTSNKMSSYPMIENFDEYPYIVPKTYPNKFSGVKSQDIINVLNKLHAKEPHRVTIVSNYEEKSPNSKAPSKSTTEKYRDEQLGTTLMFNGVDLRFVSDIWLPKKMSKHSLKNMGRENKDLHPVTKVNKQPQQYYNTPLPMKNEQFEKFLKENQLDVESVTIPMIGIPTITETWHSKDNPLTKTIDFNKNMKIERTTTTTAVKTAKVTDNKETTKVGYKNGMDGKMDESIDTSYPENQIEYLNDLENDLLNYYGQNEKIRQKRSSVHDYDTLTDNILIGKENIIQSKDKSNDVKFYKNLEKSTDSINSVSSPNTNEVDITIINFDDADNTLGYNKPVLSEHKLLKVNSSIKDNKAVTGIDTSKTKTKEAPETRKLQELHNSEDGITNFTQLKLKDDLDAKEKIAPMNLNQLPNELSAKCKNKQGILPKRVKISSQSYKYDVLYNVPDIKEEDDLEVKTPAYVSDIKRSSKEDSGKEGTNSEIHQVMIIVDVINAVNDFTKPDTRIHLDLPTYYAPNTEIDSTKLLPVSLKTSWTDLVLKYISGIALIEMLNKLGVLKGGLNLTDGLDLNIDRGKGLSKDGIIRDGTKLRFDRAAKTTKKRHTFSQTIHFTREMIKQRNKRLFQMLPVMKEKLKLFAQHKSTTSTMTPAATKSLKVITNDMNLATNRTTTEGKFTKRNERNFEELDNNDYGIFDYKGDIDGTTEANKKASKISMHPILIINNKRVDLIENKTKPIINNEGVYVEEYGDGVYYELGVKSNKADKKTKTTRKNPVKVKNKKVTDFNSYKLKRDVRSETFTAKNVAALEVIVDLMKNTPIYEENSIKMISHNNFIAAQHSKPRKNKNEKMEHITNSIKVHIAIPYDVPDKRRSLDSIKVRKVFSAKMATPIDLEYQIHSIEDNVATTSVSPSDLDYGLSPGMYLLVEDPNTLSDSLSLKPVNAPTVHMRSVVTEKLEAETKTDRVKLSKEFVAAVNKHLIQLYENMTAAGENEKKHKVKRREASWEKVRKFFGHDRVCNCKCKENKTMCRACAASDAVIKELTFEFDNLAKYMSDHCTEIQTFFWMNPIGGRKLRDSVRRIDKSLNDYYKRVKGKCQGRTCKTFATYIDKRDFDKKKKITKNNIGETMIDDLKSLDSVFATSLNFIAYDETLKEKGAEFVRAATNCIVSKPFSKRSSINNKMKQKYDQNDVYTLDNISVNIICSPEASSDSTNMSRTTLVETSPTESGNNNIFLDYDVNKRNCRKYNIKKRFRKNKLKLNKLFTYYDTQVTAGDIFKREAINDQIQSPIIADTGGSFWHDYLSKGNVDVSNDKSKPKVEISVVQTNSEKPLVTRASTKTTNSFKDKLKKINKKNSKFTASKTTKSYFSETLKDSLSYNMNELFKLIGTIKDVEEVKNTFTDPTIVTKKHKTKKTKTKKRKKVHKTSKSKVHHKPKTKTTKMSTDTPSIPSNTNNTMSTSITVDKTATLNEIKTATGIPKHTETFDSFPVEEITASLEQAKNIAKQQSTTTKKNLYNKIKMATLGFLSKIGKGNYIVDSKTTKPETDDVRKNSRSADTKDITLRDKKLDSSVISEVTTKMNPTILIINEKSTEKEEKHKEKAKYKNILLSLLNYEKGKLDKIKKILNKDLEEGKAEASLVENLSQEDVDDIEHALMELKLQSKMTTKASQQDNDYDILKVLKTIRPELEIPAPPDLHLQPGMLEKIVNKFDFKVVTEKVAEKPILKSITKYNFGMTKARQTKKQRTDFEEAGPIKTSNLNLHDKRQSNYFEKHLQSSKNPRKRSDLSANCDSMIRHHIKVRDREETMTTTEKSGRIIQRALARKTTIKSHKYIRKPEFDTFIRKGNGIYRLRLKKDTEESFYTSTEVTEKHKRDNYDYSKTLQETKTAKVGLKRNKRKHKRSDDKLRDNLRLSMWLQHNTGFFLATVTCLYILFVLCSSVVNWLF